jgi:hypothetical protein
LKCAREENQFTQKKKINIKRAGESSFLRGKGPFFYLFMVGTRGGRIIFYIFSSPRRASQKSTYNLHNVDAFIPRFVSIGSEGRGFSHRGCIRFQIDYWAVRFCDIYECRKFLFSVSGKRWQMFVTGFAISVERERRRQSCSQTASRSSCLFFAPGYVYMYFALMGVLVYETYGVCPSLNKILSLKCNLKHNESDGEMGAASPSQCSRRLTRSNNKFAFSSVYFEAVRC